MSYMGRLLAQPPSGGCVLKQSVSDSSASEPQPAAFGRLCVETSVAFGFCGLVTQPPSGGCVLKLAICENQQIQTTSRLRAAVC